MLSDGSWKENYQRDERRNIMGKIQVVIDDGEQIAPKKGDWFRTSKGDICNASYDFKSDELRHIVCLVDIDVTLGALSFQGYFIMPGDKAMWIDPIPLHQPKRTVKRIGWVNIYRSDKGFRAASNMGAYPYQTKDEAIRMAYPNDGEIYLGPSRIEYEVEE
jgi:hypothetical protein